MGGVRRDVRKLGKLNKYINTFLEYEVKYIDAFLKRMNKRRVYGLAFLVFLIVAGIVGFYIYKYYTIMTMKVTVTVAKVEKKTVPVWIDYVGTAASPRNVDIRARVEGFLIEQAFKEGDDVKEGDLMFVIDKKPFEAALQKSKATLADAKANYAYAKEQVERYTPLVTKEYVTREEYDRLVTDMKEAEAAVKKAEGQVKEDELNLGYCEMYAPVTGRVGKTFVHVGNLVGAGQDTKLATVVELDPIWIYFSPSMEDLRKILEYKAKGELPVDIYFQDGTRYPYQGNLDFVDNVVESSTSTVNLRATVPNPQKALLPGTYVNARLFISTFPNALLIPSEAISEDQKGSFVLLVNDKKIVEERQIKPGPIFDGNRVIYEGVKQGELVITEGIQLAKPGSKVNVKLAKPAEEKKGVL